MSTKELVTEGDLNRDSNNETNQNYKINRYKSFGTSAAYTEDTPAAYTAGLYKQLIGKNRQKSHFYNTLLLACFNMNIAHFCFPYLTSNVGLFPMIALIIVSILISSFTQRFILSFLTNFKSECNYGRIVEISLGNFMAYVIEILAMIWYLSLMIVAALCLEQMVGSLFSKEFYLDNEAYIRICTLGGLFIIFVLLNSVNKPFVIDFYVFLCLLVQLVSIILALITMTKYIDSRGGTIEVVKIFKTRTIFDVINITTICSNTIVLNFWVHSKYQLSSSTDNSSSIVNISSIIVAIYYIIISVISAFTYVLDDNETFPKFILYRGATNRSSDDTIRCLELVYLLINSLSFLMMINFYFKCVKEVVLRKHLSVYFTGNR